MRWARGTVARTIYGNSIKTSLAGSDLTDRDTVVSVMLAKHFIQPHALQSVTNSRLKMAAQGMFSANRVADYLGVCHAAITGEGDCHVLGSVADRVLAKHLAGKPAPEAGVHDPADPGDRLNLFHARTLTIVQEAQPYLETPGLEARLAIIPDALALAEAYCAEEALQLLQEHGTEYAEIAAVRDVFALSYLDQHATWYLTHRLLEIDDIATIKQQLRHAIDNLAQCLPQLLDAFGFDDEILGAPVLSEDLPTAWESRCNDPQRH
ncbi:acyl-CoA dehydrogenase [Nocardia sp. SYP-A9097]|uniref:acyl-CoA dehydrogenase n=1 Tax=Nocardia sp. SYP-A9097 TaxID=2663237 RepID=UPI0018910711|nr:acyl-CoA dehydrogenase [Nocardia sp. SYP-A9097]